MRRFINSLIDAFYPRVPGEFDFTPFHHKVVFLLLVAGLAAVLLLRS